MSLRKRPSVDEVQTFVDLRPLVLELWDVVGNLQQRVEAMERRLAAPDAARAKPEAPTPGKVD